MKVESLEAQNADLLRRLQNSENSNRILWRNQRIMSEEREAILHVVDSIPPEHRSVEGATVRNVYYGRPFGVRTPVTPPGSPR